MPSDAVSDLKSRVLDLLNEAGLSRISGAIPDFIKDSLILKAKGARDASIPIGRTKIGGAPDLTPDLEWPIWQGEPLAFIAQINLAELPDIEFLSVLPKSGTLYFFYSAEQLTSGYNPDEKDSWRVLWASNSECRRAKFPTTLTQRSRYKSCSVTLVHSITIPGYEALCLDDLNLSRNERDQYLDFWPKTHKTIGSGGRIHRLLGYPDEIQTEMQMECQLVSHGIYYGNSTGRNDPRASVLKAGAKDWELSLSKRILKRLG
jgi:uncharacterized protein YwqG